MSSGETPSPSTGTKTYRVLARTTPLLHGAYVVALVGGALIVARRPGFARVHLPLVAAMAAVAGTRSDCPLTMLEQHARVRSGLPRHESGFVEHYIVKPLHPPGITPRVQKALIAGWVIPNVLGYVAAWRRAR